ncbi:adenylate and guanylate cyclase catalytic domain-containing protein [Mycobacteroides abscessus subsp. abscessus]|nr:adenylate and guanylate cyclase catalytic domain-containing protein [Mycobacteroides abscessus subsp. abscessus]SIH20343.1 adenylate and guanylate cyclase catalytic domain-containing protein [Mycobacteroides abscessus subsp. abscessus]SII58377.1 adenylate and guanylate cyclase catalytic domain-containing protein [Mycobacteroides abscessus subsp. abscessus]SII65526.1 adenylate and guanylate cyclase catalytic domain-containing protein [Mycobacteroides abscessus subsp. abscessus]SIK66527.1 aden
MLAIGPGYGANMTEQASVSIEEALEATRTGDIWVFRGRSGPDRLIQTLSNSPVNHVGMTLAIDDLPPLMWHAELGNKLTDVWTGDNHRGVQLHDAREAIERWAHVYGQRCWLRQLSPRVSREQEDIALRVVARMDGTPFPATARLTGRWMRGRLPTVSDLTRGLPFVHKKVREAAERDIQKKRQAGLETAFCAETVAITLEEMGLLVTEKRSNYFDPGSFWSGDNLPLAPGYSLSREIAVDVPAAS